ncbi:MAG TPA: lipid-A-disaccharide synthase N-terminal domain-containing protein [Thermoanaerobaculia bacterium]|nr:lipid-A-disaccharide synthase N-terminal domain-containing protein [Thermoanaerobaculia bacterium]
MTLHPSSWDLWVAVGFLGQLFFSARFLIQWIWSEKKKASFIPIHFWYFSLLGGMTLALYAFHRRDPVFLLGQTMGLVVYARNLMLIRNEKTPVDTRAPLR